MQIHVLGVGSIGSLLALHLRHSTTHPITLLVKRKSFAQTLRQELEQTITIERDGSLIRADGFTIELTDPAADRLLGLLRRPDGQLRSNVLRPRSAAASSPTPSPRESTGRIASLIVTTKAPSTIRALRALSPRLTPDSTITLLQNGMGTYEELCAKLFPLPETRPHFIIANTTHGAWSKRPFFTVHAGMGDLVFGVAPSTRFDLPVDFGKENHRKLARSKNQETKSEDLELRIDADQEARLNLLKNHESLVQTVRALLSLRGLHPSWISASDLQERLQRKLVTNSIINPLTAILGCRNGTLVGNRYAHRIGRDVCAEAEKVFRAQLLEDENYPPSGEGEKYTETDLANANIPQKLTAESLEHEFVRVARLTAVNFSSMLQDVRKGNETEVDYMNGYLCRMGMKYGIPTPVNDTLRTLVKLKTVMPGGEEK